MTQQTDKLLSYAPIVLVLTFVFFFFLPRTFNFITFFLPAFYLAKVLSRNGKGFNFIVLLFILLLAVVIPTGFFTLDTTGDDVIYASEPTMALVWNFGVFFNIGVAILVFILPMVLVGLVVWAYYQGKLEEGTSMLMKIILVVLLFFVGCIILDWFGLLPAWFIWRWIRDIFIYILGIFAWLGNSTFKLFTGDWENFSDFPDFPQLGGFSLSEIVSNPEVAMPDLSFLSTTDPLPNFFIQLNGAIPFVLAFFGLYLWLENKYGKNPYKIINTYIAQEEKDKSVEIKLVKFNAPAVVFGVMVLVYAFAIFLNFTNSGLDMGLYLIITIFCLILIIIGVIPIKTGTFIKTLEGIGYGVSGVFLFYNLLSSGLNVLSTINPADLDPTFSMLNQVFFVAPTESLIFHVVIPSLGLLGTYYIMRRADKRNRIENLQKEIVRLELLESKLRELYNQILITNTKSIKYRGEKYTQSQLSAEIFNTANKIEILKLKEIRKSKITLNSLMFSKWSYGVLSFVLAFLLPNFIFSTYHSFRSPYNFIQFWSNGVAFIYLGAGCWLTLISIRYGWLPCILSHALINIISIILAGVFI